MASQLGLLTMSIYLSGMSPSWVHQIPCSESWNIPPAAYQRGFVIWLYLHWVLQHAEGERASHFDYLSAAVREASSMRYYHFQMITRSHPQPAASHLKCGIQMVSILLLGRAFFLPGVWLCLTIGVAQSTRMGAYAYPSCTILEMTPMGMKLPASDGHLYIRYAPLLCASDRLPGQFEHCGQAVVMVSCGTHLLPIGFCVYALPSDPGHDESCSNLAWSKETIGSRMPHQVIVQLHMSRDWMAYAELLDDVHLDASSSCRALHHGIGPSQAADNWQI